MEIINATLDTLIFYQETSHYAVALFVLEELNDTLTVTGTFLNPVLDAEYELHGEYVVHPKYGRQFNCVQFIRQLPKKKKAIVHLLSSSAFKGIGPKLANKIYESLGEECLERLHENIDLLDDISGITPAKKAAVQEGLTQFAGMSHLTSQLLSYQIDIKRINLLQEAYQDNLEQVIHHNPFQPYYEVYGFGYQSAIKLADGLSLEAHDSRRQQAYVFEKLRTELLRRGDTYLSLEQLVQSCRLLSQDQVDECLQALSNLDSFSWEDDKLSAFHLLDEEKDIAHLLKEHLFPVLHEDIEPSLSQAELKLAIDYADEQKEAIRTFFETSLMILTGGPGTGKTTIVKGILTILDDVFPHARVQLCAPTGRASKRLSQLSDHQAKTIHSLLKWNMDANVFDLQEPLDCDFLIVDEFSMVDTHLFASLLNALRPTCRLLLIGDPNQLESVGPGSVLANLIQSNQFPMVQLQHIYRQQAGSGIVSLARQIQHLEPLSFDEGVDFIPLEDRTLWSQIDDLLEQGLPQFLVCQHTGPYGIEHLNQYIQSKINPKGKSLTLGKTCFRVNDKVMLLKNLPDDNVFNGDLGTIIDIHQHTITVDFQPEIVEFDTDILTYLKHAWAISIHKSQGSEYPDVVLIVDRSHQHMLNQRLIYTAVSRAKRHLTIFSQIDTFQTAIQTKPHHIRQSTLLAHLLRQ